MVSEDSESDSDDSKSLLEHSEVPGTFDVNLDLHGNNMESNRSNKKSTASVKNFDYNTRHTHKRQISPEINRNNKQVNHSSKKPKVVYPHENKKIKENYDEILQIDANMENYFPKIDKASKTWYNITGILRHSCYAYSNMQADEELHSNLQAADIKITTLQNKITEMEQRLAMEKDKHATKMNLDKIIKELRQELGQNIESLIWFVEPKPEQHQGNGVYNPKVGEDDFDMFLGKVCRKYFFSSEKYVRKLQNNVKSIDISKLKNKYIIWKYIWKTEDFGKNISTELNNKRNTFLHMIKTAFEVVMTTKSELFQHEFLIKISNWLTKPTLHSEEFVFIKNTMFVILASMMKKIKFPSQ